jgi:alkylhydroperoxidase/carboxymuconolactone decarboxylase family protein YurZ
MEKVRASRLKFHILYRTTCAITDRYYIGIHSTDKIEDGYLGSGIHLTRSLKKHGRVNHTRVILEILDNRDLLKKREAEVVTDDLVKNDVLCMNLIKGGNANDREFGVTEKTRELLSIASKRFVRTKEHYEKAVATRKANNSYGHSEETIQKIVNTRKMNGPYPCSEERKAQISARMLGHEVSAETRKKIAAAVKKNAEAGLRKMAPLKSIEHREKLRQAQTGKKYSDESRALMSLKAKARGPATGRSCTIDGIEIFSSIKGFIRKLGKGKAGLKHPNFRFVTSD